MGDHDESCFWGDTMEGVGFDPLPRFMVSLEDALHGVHGSSGIAKHQDGFAIHAAALADQGHVWAVVGISHGPDAAPVILLDVLIGVFWADESAESCPGPANAGTEGSCEGIACGCANGHSF